MSNLRYNSIDDFGKDMAKAFKTAETEGKIEIWMGGDYFTLQFHSLQHPVKNPYVFSDMYPDKDLGDFNSEEAYEMGVDVGLAG